MGIQCTQYLADRQSRTHRNRRLCTLSLRSACECELKQLANASPTPESRTPAAWPAKPTVAHYCESVIARKLCMLNLSEP